MQIYQTKKSYIRFRDIDMDWDIGSPSSQNSWMDRVASQVSQYLPQATQGYRKRGVGEGGLLTSMNYIRTRSFLLRLTADQRTKVLNYPIALRE
jgi:hypothetical protein